MSDSSPFDELRKVPDRGLTRTPEEAEDQRIVLPMDRDTCLLYVQIVYVGGLTAPADLDAFDQSALPPNMPPLDGARSQTIQTWWSAAHHAVDEAVTGLVSAHVRDLEQSKTLFHHYGTEIGSALLLAALPEAYASAWGSRILAATGQLSQRTDLRRRIRATAQFLTQVFSPDGDVTRAWDRDDGSAFRCVVGLRLFHQVIRGILASLPDEPARQLLGPRNTGENHPLNQEDLLATQLSFVVSVLEVLERFGIAWTAEEQFAYLQAWRLIGAGLGIEPLPSELASLEPTTVQAARDLLTQLRDRQWGKVTPFVPQAAPKAGGAALEAQWESLGAGRLLVRALVDELVAALPSRRTHGWPLALMRELTPSVVHDRLGLGGNGFLMTALDALPDRSVPVARFTRLPAANPLKARVLRGMANTVTRQTVIAWLRSDPPFVLPGLEAWSSGFQTSG